MADKPIWYLVVSLPLVGVLIGALLTPYVTYRYAKASAKLQLRSNLIKSLSDLYNCIIAYEQVSASKERYAALYESMDRAYKDQVSISDKERIEEILRMRVMFLKANTDETEKCMALYLKIVEHEGNITAQIFQIKSFWTNAAQVKIRNVYDDESTTRKKAFGFNWSELDPEMLDQESNAFGETFKRWEKECNAMSKRILNAVDETLE